MKPVSKWPLYSYIACIVGAATVAFLRLYAAQRGGNQLSSGAGISILLSLTPFGFAAFVLNFNPVARAVKVLSLAIIFQTLLTIAGYYYAIFREVGVEGIIDLGMVPLYQFIFIGVAAGAVSFIKEPKSRGVRIK